MTLIRRLFCIITVLALAACGGGGGSSGTSGFNTGGTTGGGATSSTPSAADLVFVLSATTVANSGTETVVATATAIDANRNTVAGVPVTISVNNEGVVTPSGSVTGAAGTITGTVGIGSNRTNRSLTVTATSGGLTRTAVLQVQDTGGGTSGPSDLLLILSASTIGSAGNQTVTANVTALDAKRNVLPGATVTLSVNNGTIAPAGTTTGSNGVISGAVSTAGSPTGTVIVVTAVAGSITRTANLRVVDLPSTSNPTAADLSLALSSTQLSNGGTGSITATITAVDSNRNALAGIPITVTVDSNAVATVSGPTTNSQGVVTATIGYGSDRSFRSVLITATSGTVSKTASFTVTGAKLTASFAPQIAASAPSPQQIIYTVVDDNANPMGNQAISIHSTATEAASGTTDAFGKFTYNYVVPAPDTTFHVDAVSAGLTLSSQVQVQATGGTVAIASSAPVSASLTPSPTVVSVNSAASTGNQVELRALFLGANNKPIENVRVKFSLDPANASDGAVTQVSSPYVYSDATGVARATFTPGQRSSPTNGVTVRGCWDTGDFDVTVTCPANRQISANLTIASEALSVNIRTNNLIQTGTSNLTYIKQFVVMVVDAAGQAKSGVLITPSIDLTAYYKGIYVFSLSWKQQLQLANTENYRWDQTTQAWQLQAAASPPQPSCPNEDVNRNGVREANAYPGAGSATALSARGEDLNWNGDIDPRKSDVSIRMVGSATTDSSGLAIVQIEYGQNLASWVDYVITVTASGVAGTESRASYVGSRYGNGNLPFPASAVTDETTPPAFVVSPYGRGSGTGTPLTANFVATGVCTDTN